MKTDAVCPNCGAECVPATDAATPACPRCLLVSGLEADAAPTKKAGLLSEFPEDPPEHHGVERGASGGEPAVRFPDTGSNIGPYRLLQQIGEGGFGVVYMAEQKLPVRRRVALKVVKLGMDTKAVVARFEAERQALALMDHPNIAKVLDAGATSTGRPYFVMELVRGIRITDYCRQNRLGARQRLELFVQVANAIQHAHQKGIIHRDIKPSNVLVTLYDGVPVPKVIDFGIAKATAGQELTDKTMFTAFEQFMGTPVYMSPEQAEMSGLDIDTRSDIYSAGVLLYELLTGQTPFEGRELSKAGIDGIRRIIREKEPPRPSTRFSSLNLEDRTTMAAACQSSEAALQTLLRGDLDSIVMRCLEKDRNRRYPTAGDLAADVLRYLANEPVTARPQSAVYRFQKLFQRNRLAISAAGAAVLALIAGIAIVSWLLHREHLALQRAKASEAEQARLKEIADAGRKVADEERKRADEQTLSAERRLERFQAERVEELFRSDNSPLALASLAQIIRRNPSNDVAVTRTISALTFGSFILPRVVIQREAAAAEFHPREPLVAIASPDGSLAIVRTDTGAVAVGPVGGEPGVIEVLFNADGTRLLTASKDGSTLWDSSNLTRLASCRIPGVGVLHRRFVEGEPLMVVDDGASRLSIRSAATGKVLAGPFPQPLDPMHGLHARFFGDRKLLLINGSSLALVLDAGNGSVLAGPQDLGGSSPSIAFSPDGHTLLVGSAGSFTARLADLPSLAKRGAGLEHQGNVRCVAASPDGRWYATGSGDLNVHLWDARTGELVSDRIRHETPASQLVFSPNGDRLVVRSVDGLVRVWQVPSCQPLSEPRLIDGQVTRISPDGLTLFAGKGEVSVLWELRSGGVRPDLVSRGDPASRSKVAPGGGARLEFGPMHYFATLVSTVRGVTNRHRLRYYGDRVTGDFSPDGRSVLLVVSCDDTRWCENNVYCLDVATGEPKFPPILHPDHVFHAAFSRDGRRIATLSRDDHARVVDASTGTLLRDINSGVRNEGGVEFSPDGSRLLVFGDSNTAQVWAIEAGTNVFNLEHRGRITDAHFSPDGRWLATSGEDKLVRIWSASDGHLVNFLRHEDPVTTLCFSAAGDALAAGCMDGTLQVWDPERGDTLTGPIRTHAKGWRSRLWKLEFSADSRRVLGMATSDLVTWDLPVSHVVAPEWLPELAEYVGGRSLAENGQDQVLGTEPLIETSLELASNGIAITNTTTAWLAWCFESRMKRTVTPTGSNTVAMAIQQRIQAAEPEALTDAVALAEGDPMFNDQIRLGRELASAIELANGLEAEGRYADARSAFADVLVKGRSLWAPGAFRRRELVLDAVRCGVRAGATDAVDELSREGLAIRDLCDSILAEGDDFWDFNNWAAAAKCYREAFRILQAHEPVNRAALAESLELEACSLVYSGREAEALKSFEHLMAISPDGRLTQPWTVQKRGFLRVREGNWVGAAEDFDRLTQLEPGEHWHWYRASVLQRKCGNTNRYVAMCREMIARFGRPQGDQSPEASAALAERTAKVILMVPPPADLLDEAAILAERSVKLGATSGWLPYFQFAAGLAEFRRGNHDSATRVLTGVLAKSGVDPIRDTQAEAVLAMCQVRLGRRADGTASLAKAGNLLRDVEARVMSGESTDSFHDYLVAQVLVEEARAVVSGTLAPAPSPSKQR